MGDVRSATPFTRGAFVMATVLDVPPLSSAGPELLVLPLERLLSLLGLGVLIIGVV